MTDEQRKKFTETKALLTQQLVPEKHETVEQFEQRKRIFKEKQISAFKEILLQDISKNSTNRSFSQYTKSLVKQYLKNPYSYRTQLRYVSQYLYRVCTLYKKIILYYSCMPTYNYMLTKKVDFTKEIDAKKTIKEYQKILLRHQSIDFERDFSQAIAIAQRDGIYCSYAVSLDDNGLFHLILDPEYYKIVGKNESGQWVVAFDATYFSKGNNSQFVEGIDGDTSGCYPDVFIEGWKNYNADSINARWFLLPPDKTFTLLANMDDEFDIPLPFWSGIFVSLLDMLDYEQIIADKTTLENYVLLVSKIPLLNSDIVDDFAVSLEMVEAMQELINAAVPELCGTAFAPFDIEKIDFSRSNSTQDTDMLSNSINTIFDLAGPPQLVVSGGGASQSTAIKQAIANDSSLAFHWLDKLEKNFQYYLEKNISDKYLFSIHKQTWYYQDEYIGRIKDAATLGAATPMEYMTALGSTPYEAWCKLKFESVLGMRELMIPLQSSYTSNTTNVGRPEQTDLENPESIDTRESDKNAGTKDRKG